MSSLVLVCSFRSSSFFSINFILKKEEVRRRNQREGEEKEKKEKKKLKRRGREGEEETEEKGKRKRRRRERREEEILPTKLKGGVGNDQLITIKHSPDCVQGSRRNK